MHEDLLVIDPSAIAIDQPQVPDPSVREHYDVPDECLGVLCHELKAYSDYVRIRTIAFDRSADVTLLGKSSHLQALAMAAVVTEQNVV